MAVSEPGVGLNADARGGARHRSEKRRKPGGRGSGVLRSRVPGLLIFLFYVGLAIAYEGRSALSHFGGGTIGAGPDVQIYLWGLHWWPYALGHGVNPFVSHVVWPPYGANVLWTTTVPALSLLIAPLTLTLNTAVAWNTLVLLAPASSAWAAYALCRELTGKRWPSMIGGAVFGFSSYELAEGMAHLHLTFAMLVPLGALVTIRHVRGRLSGPRLAVCAALMAVIQFFISPEILATALLMGAITAAGAFVLLSDVRRRLARGLIWAGGGLAVAALAVAAPVATMFSAAAPRPSSPSALYPTDLVNLVVPTRVTALGGSAAAAFTLHHFPGNLAEQCGYIGVPLLALIAVFAVVRRSSRGAWLLLFAFAVAVLLSLGTDLTVAGRPVAWLPGAVLFKLPVLQSALPSRFAMYAALAAGVIVAVLLATPRRWPTLAVSSAWAVASLAMLAPGGSAALWWRPTPPAIAQGTLARAITPGSTVISLPFYTFADHTLYAQAVDGMRFNVLDNWMQVTPQKLKWFTRSRILSTTDIRPGQLAWFRHALCALRINYAVAWWPKQPWGGFLWLLHVKGVNVGHVWVYRLPACTTA
jgi:hypothetical protein